MEGLNLLWDDRSLFYRYLLGGWGCIYKGCGMGGLEGRMKNSWIYLGGYYWRGLGGPRWANAFVGRGRWWSGFVGDLWALRYQHLLMLKCMRLLDLWYGHYGGSYWSYITAGSDLKQQWALFVPWGGWGWALIDFANFFCWDQKKLQGGFCSEAWLTFIGSNSQSGRYGFLTDIYNFGIYYIKHDNIWRGISWRLGWNLSILFLLFYFLYLATKIITSLGRFSSRSCSQWVYFIDVFIYSWLFMGEDKTETSEEIICLMILWPWCIFIIFSHLFSWNGEGSLFGFAEWGIPVIYGFILLLEHAWELGVYIFVYLNGARGRYSLLVSVIEDIVATVIMFARVGLQVVRGVIVGMFHFVCRESLLTFGRWWDIDIYFAGAKGFGGGQVGGFYCDYWLGFLDLCLAGGVIVVITAIMFLQLILLIVSVWLFCKCWYISATPSIVVVNTNGVFGIAAKMRRGVGAYESAAISI